MHEQKLCEIVEINLVEKGNKYFLYMYLFCSKCDEKFYVNIEFSIKKLAKLLNIVVAKDFNSIKDKRVRLELKNKYPHRIKKIGHAFIEEWLEID